MTPDQRRLRAKQIFLDALDMSHADALAHVARACDGDDALRAEVETLLAAAGEDDFLRPPSPHADLETLLHDAPVGEQPGDRVGRYTLRERLGEGGMGVVFLAEQTEPVRREVALKVIKVGMDTRAVVARFRAEQQALASLDHPGVARVFDAGATESGRPYFVMELVRGEPITTWCDRRERSLRQRLELFADVCRAVQHAHQKGLIHRDLKPSNILVEAHDARAVPKIIDFGVAKAAGDADRAATLVTAHGQVVGTPEYMSPEQMGLDAARAVDTRSDVYSLGVVLYELLAGAPPFDASALRSMRLDEAQRFIAETDPPRPSTRLSRLDHPDQTAISARRAADPSGVTRALRGDLDWIVMRAMEKDPDRRYASASELGADLERFLWNEPVLARPPSAVYRAHKFVRRNRAGVLAGGVGALAVGVGVIASVAGFYEARTEAARARTEAAKSAQIASFLEEMISGVEPSVALGRDTTILRDILESTSARAGEALAEQPLVEASIRATLGATYHAIGDYGASAEQFRRSADLREAELGADDRQTLDALASYGVALGETGRYEEALAIQRRVHALRVEHFGPDHPETIPSLHNIASMQRELGKFEESLEAFRASVEGFERVYGPDAEQTLTTRSDYAGILSRLGRHEEALEIMRDVSARAEASLGARHPVTLNAQNALAFALTSVGRLDESAPLYESVLEARMEVLGASHPFTLLSMNNLAYLRVRQGDLEAALPLFQEAAAGHARARGEGHPATLLALNNVAYVQNALGNTEEARGLYERVYAGRVEALGAEHRETLFSAHRLGQFRRQHADLEGAVAMLRRAWEGRTRTLGAGHADTLAAAADLSETLAEMGREEEARRLAREALEASGGEAQGELVERLRGVAGE